MALGWLHAITIAMMSSSLLVLLTHFAMVKSNGSLNLLGFVYPRDDHGCTSSLWGTLLELIPGVKDVRHCIAPYIDLDTGKVFHECVPWTDTFRHVLTFKYALPLLGDGWAFQKLLLRMNEKFFSWDTPFVDQGQDPKTEILKFCHEWGVMLKPYKWSKPLENYSTANDFFSRKYAAAYAPENNLGKASVVVPSDSVWSWYQNASSLPKLLKNEEWTLDSIGIPNHTSYVPHPAVMGYLAPYDYHCFHAPIAGTLIKAELLNQNEWSLTVKAYIYKTANILRRNRRAVMVLQSKDNPSQHVAMLAVGGVTVDSIRLENGVARGAQIRKGQLLGCFARGGSTVALLFDHDVKPYAPQPVSAIAEGFSFRTKAGADLGDFE